MYATIGVTFDLDTGLIETDRGVPHNSTQILSRTTAVPYAQT